MTFRCAHMADIHFRGLKRHDEYRHAFEQFFEFCEKNPVDSIFIGGDIVHSKTQNISPELIDLLAWWFTKLSECAPVHCILGNHDGLMFNKDRQDAISPIVNSLANPRVHLFKNSGVYPTGTDGFNWHVFSCFDEPGWDKARDVSSSDVSIAVFHGCVLGSKTDTDWSLESDVDLTFFKDFDFAFLGDIHKYQYLDEDMRIAYPGSFIQQNYGEDTEKGFLYWEIEDTDNYKSTFVPILNEKPFVTIPWIKDASRTLSRMSGVPHGGRYRIKSQHPLGQGDVRYIYDFLKENYDAEEIVFKHESSKLQETSHVFNDQKLRKSDFRDISKLYKLVEDYYAGRKFDKDLLDRVKGIIGELVSSASLSYDAASDRRWEIKKLKFDNTFMYGTGNVIDFKNLTGVTGIFGDNRCGKSSIPGTIMYSLFNTTDRGPMKNLHVINMRKGHCLATVDFSVGGKNYRVERQSTRHQTRAGKVHAVTHLNLFALDENLDVVSDLGGEQRRETEKTLRDLVGTAEDFLLTSLASQGEMNNFIKCKAAQRKSILSKFLDLDNFDTLYESARLNASTSKALMKRMPDVDFNRLIDEKNDELSECNLNRADAKLKYESLLVNLQKLKVAIVTIGGEHVLPGDVQQKSIEISRMDDELNELKAQVEMFNNDIVNGNMTLQKIENLRQQFPVEELSARKESYDQLNNELIHSGTILEKERSQLKNLKTSVKILEQVPCGDMFPKCKFIKNAHCALDKIQDQKEKTTSIMSEVRAKSRAIRKIADENIDQKLERYDQLRDKHAELKFSLNTKAVEFEHSKNRIVTLNERINSEAVELEKLKLNVVGGAEAEKIHIAREKINSLEDELRNIDHKKISFIEQAVILEKEINDLTNQKKEFEKISLDHRSYELVIEAFFEKRYTITNNVKLFTCYQC